MQRQFQLYDSPCLGHFTTMSINRLHHSVYIFLDVQKELSWMDTVVEFTVISKFWEETIKFHGNSDNSFGGLGDSRHLKQSREVLLAGLYLGLKYYPWVDKETQM